MRLLFPFSLLFSILVMAGCQQQEKQQAPATAPSAPANEITFDDFSKLFKPAALPYNLPESVNNDSSKELSKEVIQHFFGTIPNRSAFEQKDVPELAANAESSKYYTVGMLHGSNYSAFIIRKQEEGNYYFLVTFNDKGNPLDIMCIAFEEGSGGNKVQRKAAINEDNSILIRQDKLRMYEISPDGTIKDLRSAS